MAGVNNNLIPPVKGEIRNPGGKPKGTKHLSTWIQEMLSDDKFVGEYLEGYTLKTHNGPPIQAIVRVAALKSIAGDTKWADWLGKYGYGTKLELANNPENPITSPVTRDELDTFMQSVKDGTKQK